jgi:hypothetical protein
MFSLNFINPLHDYLGTEKTDGSRLVDGVCIAAVLYTIIYLCTVNGFGGGKSRLKPITLNPW